MGTPVMSAPASAVCDAAPSVALDAALAPPLPALEVPAPTASVAEDAASPAELEAEDAAPPAESVAEDAGTTVWDVMVWVVLSLSSSASLSVLVDVKVLVTRLWEAEEVMEPAPMVVEMKVPEEAAVGLYEVVGKPQEVTTS